MRRTKEGVRHIAQLELGAELTGSCQAFAGPQRE